MRKLMLAIVVFAFTLTSAYAKSEKNVPEKVKTAFQAKFAKATNVEWGKESKTEWEAEFRMNGQDYSANFKVDGTWVETEYKITEAQIPAAIISALQKSYVSSTIKSAEVSETPKGNVYEILILNGKKKKEVLFELLNT